uniref:Uncharacterized protein n=1 Tax=Glossina palpalis gambiensis TaxID=67801 RepID=A0A1B0AS69_9MUSC
MSKLPNKGTECDFPFSNTSHGLRVLLIENWIRKIKRDAMEKKIFEEVSVFLGVGMVAAAALIGARI